jgi:four helix bundle protein
MTKKQNPKQYDLEDRTFEFAKKVRIFVKKLRKTIANIEDGKQVIKSSGSVGANYIEGFDDGSPRELIRFLGYSQRSCSAVQSQLYRALDCKYVTQSHFDKVYELASECRKQIKGFRKYLRNYGSKGGISKIPKSL